MKYHQRKSFMLNLLDRLPNKLGYYFYHIVQGEAASSLNSKIKTNSRSIKQIQKILDQNNIDISGKEIIEIGSGWLPIMPFLFKSKLNVSRILTYDINEHYSNKNIQLIKLHFKELNFKSRRYSGLDLPDFIEYYPKTDIIKSKIKNDVSFIFSRFVLEHVRPEDIKEMHRKFYSELNKDVKVLHIISPSDHRAYSDRSLSYQDFLQYSQGEWDKIQTKFDYHNRLRLPQYIKIFEECGFKISYLKFDTVERESDRYVKFKQLEIHRDFKDFSEKEILAGFIRILLEK